MTAMDIIVMAVFIALGATWSILEIRERKKANNNHNVIRDNIDDIVIWLELITGQLEGEEVSSINIDCDKCGAFKQTLSDKILCGETLCKNCRMFKMQRGEDDN